MVMAPGLGVEVIVGVALDDLVAVADAVRVAVTVGPLAVAVRVGTVAVIVPVAGGVLVGATPPVTVAVGATINESSLENGLSPDAL